MYMVQYSPGGPPQPALDVLYEGSDLIKNGYLLCANTDYTSAATRVGMKTIAASAVTDPNPQRFTRAEKPSATNAHRFLGAVVGLGEAGKQCNGEGVTFRVAIPVGTVEAPIFTNANCVIDSTVLYLQAGSYIAGSSGIRRIGLAAQTVDRSTTNGTVSASLETSQEFSRIGTSVSARSRTAVQLPTAAIWGNFPLTEMRANPFYGSLLETDFTQGCPWFNSFVDATYAASAGGKTPTEHIFPGPLNIGELALFTTTDNQAAEMQFPASFLIPTILAPSTKFAFEIRAKQSVITTAKCGWFAGLMVPSKLVGNLIVDGGTLQTEGSIGFQWKEGSNGSSNPYVDFIYDTTGQSQNEYAAGVLAAQAADTYHTFGMYYNGTTIAMYIDGVAAGTAVPNANLDDADFPGGLVMVPTLALKAAHADDFTFTVDWIRCAQVPA